MLTAWLVYTRKWFDYLCFKISFNLNPRQRRLWYVPWRFYLQLMSYYVVFRSFQYTSKIIINQYRLVVVPRNEFVMMFNMACDVKSKEFCSLNLGIKTQGVITLYSLHNYTTSNYVIDNMWNVDGRETCKNFEFLFCEHVSEKILTF